MSVLSTETFIWSEYYVKIEMPAKKKTVKKKATKKTCG